MSSSLSFQQFYPSHRIFISKKKKLCRSYIKINVGRNEYCTPKLKKIEQYTNTHIGKDNSYFD